MSAPHLHKSSTGLEAGVDLVCSYEKFRTTNNAVHTKTSVNLVLLTVYAELCSAHVS